MKSEESVGCVMTYEYISEQAAYKIKEKEEGEDLFLLMQSRSGGWNFVKGHREHIESDEETLRREVYEETGIKSFKILGFVGKIRYRFLDKAGQSVSKEVRFYLTLSDTRQVKLSSEHINYKWTGYKEAIMVLTFPQSISILNKAFKFKRLAWLQQTNRR